MEFQGLLETKAPFPDISAKILGVSLESDLPVTAVEDEPEPNDETHAGVARANADIDVAEFHQPAAIEANPAEIVINMELPEDLAGVYPAAAADLLHNQQQNANIPQAVPEEPPAVVAIQDSEDGGDNGGVSSEDTELDAADPDDS